MTPTYLLKKIKERVVELTGGMSLGDEGKPPVVYIGDLPYKTGKKLPPSDVSPGVVVPKTVKPVPNNQLLEPEGSVGDGLDSYFPFVLMRIANITDEEDAYNDGATMAVNFIFGTKSFDTDAYMDILHLTEVIRQSFLEYPLIGGAAEVQRPLSIEISDDQAYPQWLASMATTWTIPTIERVVNFNG